MVVFPLCRAIKFGVCPVPTTVNSLVCNCSSISVSVPDFTVIVSPILILYVLANASSNTISLSFSTFLPWEIIMVLIVSVLDNSCST